MLQRRGSLYYSRLVIPRRLQGRIGRVEITKSLRTRDIRTARYRLMLWEGRIGQLYAHVRKQGSWMNREQLDALTKKYLEASFDEVENDLALDWSPVGLEEYSSKLVDECQAISAELAWADLGRTIGLAQQMAPKLGIWINASSPGASWKSSLRANTLSSKQPLVSASSARV